MLAQYLPAGLAGIVPWIETASHVVSATAFAAAFLPQARKDGTLWSAVRSIIDGFAFNVLNARNAKPEVN